MAIDGMDDLNLSAKAGWEQLYRKFIGCLPDEENQQGHGCINGINIFNYFKPWRVFGLDPQIATSQDIKNAYYSLSKIYHPDVPITGDAAIFDRLTIMYKSISVRLSHGEEKNGIYHSRSGFSSNARNHHRSIR